MLQTVPQLPGCQASITRGTASCLVRSRCLGSVIRYAASETILAAKVCVSTACARRCRNKRNDRESHREEHKFTGWSQQRTGAVGK